jgi:hypothetical protein
VRFGAGVLASLPDEVAERAAPGTRALPPGTPTPGARSPPRWATGPPVSWPGRGCTCRSSSPAGRGTSPPSWTRMAGWPSADRGSAWQGDRARTRPRRPRPAEQRPVRPGADRLPTAAAVGHQRDERDRARCGGPRRPRRGTDRVADGRGGGAGTDRRAALRGRRRVRTRRRSDALYGAWSCGAVSGATTMSLHHKLCHAPSAALWNCRTRRPTPSSCRTRGATTSRPLPARSPRCPGALGGATDPARELWELAGRLGLPVTGRAGHEGQRDPADHRAPHRRALRETPDRSPATVSRRCSEPHGAANRPAPPGSPLRPLRPRAAAARSAPERCGHGTPPCSP